MKFKGIKCDNCGATLQYSNSYDKAMTKQLLEKKGWSIGKKDLCPTCNPRNKEKQN